MHSTLERQIKKYFTTSTQFPQGWEAFLQAINDTYTHSDEDRSLIERSLELNSQELNDRYQKLSTSLAAEKELQETLLVEKKSVEKKVEERTLELHKEAARLHASLNSLNIGLIMTDVNFNISIINPAAYRILSTGEKKLTGNSNISQIISFVPGGSKILSKVGECIVKKTPEVIGEFTLAGRTLYLSVAPIITNETAQSGESNVIGTIILMQDITEKKALERSKDEFFSIASHELRTPLTAIRGNIAMIQTYYIDKLQDPELREMLSDVHKSSVRLINIVNDFLDTSRLEMGRMEFKKETFDLVPLIKEVIKEYLTTGSIKKLAIQFQEPQVKIPLVVGDKERIKQVVINLLGNAIKFTSVGGITLHVEANNTSVATYVADSGRGIPPETQSLLFRKFQQAGSNIFTRDGVQGTGLGLYISKMMVEGMHGKIWLASSELGKGTTFAFSLPKEETASV